MHALGRDFQRGLALVLAADAPGLQHGRMAFLDQRAAGVFEQRAAFRTRLGQMRLQPLGQDGRMVLGDVVQMVGDAASHVGAFIVLQGELY